MPMENIVWSVVAPRGFELTDNDGNYFFGDLLPGTYVVEYDVPESVQHTGSTRGQIVIGETTQAAVAHLFPTEHLGNEQLKGLSRKIATYRVAMEEISYSGDEL